MAKNKMSFLARELVRVPDDDIQYANDGGLQIRLPALLGVTNRARSKGLALVEAHSHPGASIAKFSRVDIEGLRDFVPYILKDLSGSPYAATVWSENSVTGLCWTTPTAQETLKEIRVIGSTVTFLNPTETKGIGRAQVSSPADRATRQVLLFGQEGQKRIEQSQVAIVGLGGIGSHVVQQLTYLGVRDFILVDPDKVETSNLNRLVGSGQGSHGKSKVDVAQHMIRSISGNKLVNVQSLREDLRTANAFRAILDSDVIFGCVDNDGPRLILNELALAYMIPYIDCAAGISVDGNRMEAGGRIVVVQPENPCLVCCKEIDTEEASNYLAPPAELQLRKMRGYVSGAELPSPSVVSLNGVMSSAAVTEFLFLTTGLKPSHAYLFYDMLEQRMVPRIVQTDPKCVCNAIRGTGDRCNVLRYAMSLTPEIFRQQAVPENSEGAMK
jgi:molybdopterin/thiamine biosynthesis adenylyltransferase